MFNKQFWGLELGLKKVILVMMMAVLSTVCLSQETTQAGPSISKTKDIAKNTEQEQKKEEEKKQEQEDSEIIKANGAKVKITSKKPVTLVSKVGDDTGKKLSVVSCLLKPSQRLRLSSQVHGVLDEVHITQGDQVEKDQLLMTLESSVEKAQLDIARNEAKYAQKNFERNKQAVEESILSDKLRDELFRQVNLAKLEQKKAAALVSQRRIQSPIEGYVYRVYANEGERVADKPVVEVIDLDPLHADIVMKADQFGRLTPGMAVSLALQYSGSTARSLVTGTVAVVDPVIDGNNGTFSARIEVANPEGDIPAGLKCQVDQLNHEVVSRVEY
ncbi:efflux RND transporter periplasmic adaptor subunit [Marinibactrum halimedae]|nr:efflux RND transporter periplasmic adaptor subunit [Marinibactrum halimedae]MCD9457635.1 efflux RND transporter periplasmic adaptor subunit [Marinibactrum halimedae]